MKTTHTPCISFLSPEQLWELGIVAPLLRRGQEESQCCKLPGVSISLYFPESETGFHILHPNPSTAPHTLVVVNQFLSKGKRNSPAAGSVSAMQASASSSPERLPRTEVLIFLYLSCLCVSVLSCFSRADSIRPHGLQPSRLLCPRDSPGKNTEVGCHVLLQGI